jgi:hypothetical protein
MTRKIRNSKLEIRNKSKILNLKTVAQHCATLCPPERAQRVEGSSEKRKNVVSQTLSFRTRRTPSNVRGSGIHAIFQTIARSSACITRPSQEQALKQVQDNSEMNEAGFDALNIRACLEFSISKLGFLSSTCVKFRDLRLRFNFERIVI